MVNVKLQLSGQDDLQCVAHFLVAEDINFTFNAEGRPYFIMDASNLGWLLNSLRQLELEEIWFLETDGRYLNEWGTEVPNPYLDNKED